MPSSTGSAWCTSTSCWSRCSPSPRTSCSAGRTPTPAASWTGRRRTRSSPSCDRYGFEVDPEALIEDIPVGVQQRVEIIKALANEARVLILDEPTAVLTPAEIDELIAVMRQLKENGTSIVFITHKLKEVKAIADKI